MNSKKDDLQKKVKTWISEQGYPLEFQAADILGKCKFVVKQGHFARDSISSKPREIDILADVDFSIGKCRLRVSHVIECKWSRDKPWAVLTRPGSIAPSACIAQTLASELGAAALWARAGDENLHTTGIFKSSGWSGFGVHTVFSGGADRAFSALQSVVSLAISEVAETDRREKNSPHLFPSFALVALPVVVIDGSLFEVSFVDGEIRVAEVKRTRLHWRGAEAWGLHSTVDIVTVDELQSFAEQRRSEVSVLGRTLKESIKNLKKAVRDRDLSLFPVSKGPRGYLGLPGLLARIRDQLD